MAATQNEKDEAYRGFADVVQGCGYRITIHTG